MSKQLPAVFAGSLALLVGGWSLAEAATFTSPLPYTSAADIPAGFYDTGTPTFLEDFEDGSLDGGMTASTGVVIAPSGITDSVDADDGAIDGSGQAGRSFFSGSGAAGITFTFATPVTAAGIVWTDGFGTITFEAFGPGMISLGTVSGMHADGSITGTTGEDRFYGVTHDLGILAIKLSNTGGGIEVDHVQYGNSGAAAPIPVPAAIPLFLSGMATLRLARRRA